MARNIFIVDAYLVTDEGVFSHFSGYPKSFDSVNYENSVDTALLRATGAFADAWSSFCESAEGRMIQNVTLTDITGHQIDRKCVGAIVETETETTA